MKYHNPTQDNANSASHTERASTKISRKERMQMMSDLSLPDWTARLHSYIASLREEVAIQDGYEGTEELEDFLTDADTQIRQLCNRANKMRIRMRRVRKDSTLNATKLEGEL